MKRGMIWTHAHVFMRRTVSDCRLRVLILQTMRLVANEQAALVVEQQQQEREGEREGVKRMD